MAWSGSRKTIHRIFLALLVAAAAGMLVASPAAAQTQGRVPGKALGGLSDSELWRQVRKGVSGTVSIPDKKAALLVQSEGDNWRAIRNGPVSVIGGWAMLAGLVVLAVFFAVRRRIGIDAGFCGRMVRRFNNIEVFSHWLTASSFVVLGLTGLNILYGRYVLIPVIGQEAFAVLAAWGKIAHDFLAFSFMLGLLLTLFIWFRDNLPDRYDLGWLAKGGGLFSKGVHPAAGKFNTGQKFIFWTTIIGGGVLSVTGLYLLFPFSFGDIFIMQLVQIIHAVAALVMVIIIVAHIYIGTLGMVGAFSAISTGYVDENWARQHHSAWTPEGGDQPAATRGGERPAE